MVRVVVHHSKTTKALRAVRRSLPARVQLGLQRHAQFAVKFIQNNRFEDYPGPFNEDPDRTRLYRRTGKLKKSITHHKSAGKNTGVVITAGSGLPDRRAVLNEFGGVIAGPVEVPLPANLTAKTGQRKIKNVGEALAKGGFWRTSKNGFKIVLIKRGAKNRGKTEALFIIKDSVKIKPRFKFRHTIANNVILRLNRFQHVREGIRQPIAKNFGVSKL